MICNILIKSPVADPDFELRSGLGSILLAQPAFLPSVISSFFTQNKEGAQGAPQAPPLDPPLISKQHSVIICLDDQSSIKYGIHRINITFGKKENDTWDKLTVSSEDSTSYTQNYKWEK